MQVETAAGRSSADAVLQRSSSELIDRMKVGLASQRRFRLVELDGGQAELAVRPNWAAWGARVVLRFVPMDASNTLVEMRWTPALATTVVAWGQGKRDLVAISQLLDS